MENDFVFFLNYERRDKAPLLKIALRKKEKPSERGDSSPGNQRRESGPYEL